MVVSSTTVDVVKLGSYLDRRNVAAARTVIHGVLDRATGEVVLDAEALRFVDTAGLAMLMRAHVRAERAGQTIVLRNCSDEIRRVLAVTRLNRILRVDRRHLTLSA